MQDPFREHPARERCGQEPCYTDACRQTSSTVDRAGHVKQGSICRPKDVDHELGISSDLSDVVNHLLVLSFPASFLLDASYFFVFACSFFLLLLIFGFPPPPVFCYFMLCMHAGLLGGD